MHLVEFRENEYPDLELKIDNGLEPCAFDKICFANVHRQSQMTRSEQSMAVMCR